MTKLFALDEEINAESQVLEVLTGLGLDAVSVVAQAHSDVGRNSLRERTAQAQARGVFGAPTFFVRGEMFWGNDRLDDALDFAVRTAPGP
jgi:2-hydroxychromene-2-carboxylate isomerase